MVQEGSLGAERERASSSRMGHRSSRGDCRDKPHFSRSRRLTHRCNGPFSSGRTPLGRTSRGQRARKCLRKGRPPPTDAARPAPHPSPRAVVLPDTTSEQSTQKSTESAQPRPRALPGQSQQQRPGHAPFQRPLRLPTFFSAPPPRLLRPE